MADERGSQNQPLTIDENGQLVGTRTMGISETLKNALTLNKGLGQHRRLRSYDTSKDQHVQSLRIKANVAGENASKQQIDVQ